MNRKSSTIHPLSAHEVIRFACEELQTVELERDTHYYVGAWSNLESLPRAVRNEVQAALDEFDLRKAHEDAFVIIPAERTVVLLGQNERAALFAVYTYLERACGRYAVYPGETVAGPVAPLDAPYLDQPAIGRRGFVFETINELDYMRSKIDWMAKNRVSEIFLTFMLWDQLKDSIAEEIRKRGMKVTLGGHSLKFFMQVGRQADFGHEDGVEKLLDAVVAYCASVPGLTRLSLWPEDVAVEQAEGSVAKQDFLAAYIRFTERLKERLQRSLPTIQVEHIAYNAGLSWSMLEPGQLAGSSADVDTLYAYWGRDYHESLQDPANEATARAWSCLLDWRKRTLEKKRKLTIFEYYSDHYMLSYLFPMLTQRIAVDMEDYKKLDVDGIVNLVVPYRPKKASDAFNPDAGYNWHWAHGCNSFFFARMSWGQSYEDTVKLYLHAYPEAGREEVKRVMVEVEDQVSRLSSWNVPLFPHRAVDPEALQTEAPEGLLPLLEHISQISLNVTSDEDTPALRQLRYYIEALADGARSTAQVWRGRERG